MRVGDEFVVYRCVGVLISSAGSVTPGAEIVEGTLVELEQSHDDMGPCGMYVNIGQA
jgi:hypothetical protein